MATKPSTKAKYLHVVLLGPPGAGKGTQAVSLSQNLGLIHVASGDLFRQAQEEGSELGLLAKSYMEKGQLVPDEITIKMILERLSNLGDEKGVILDGFPRNLGQAKALDEELRKRDRGIDKAIYIRVSTEELIRRLSGRWICRNCQRPYHSVSSPPKASGKCDLCGGELYQRQDDSEETARKRLEVYFDQTLPLIEYYAQAGKLTEVNGEQSIEEVGKILGDSLT